MDYLNFSLLTEADFDDVVFKAGGRRYTENLRIKELNCDYIFGDAVIELKIIEEEPIDKISKQEKLAKLFHSDFKTVVLNPLDLDLDSQRKYYQELASPIKGQLKKASKQLKKSAMEVGAKVKVAIIMNNGLTMTGPDEFQKLAVERAENDTSGIDILIVCGMYYFSDKFDSYAFFKFEDTQIQGEKRSNLVEKLRSAWFEKVSQYMTKQITDLDMKRMKEPIQDLFFELNGIRYVKPPIQWGAKSEFYGEGGRPREDTTGMMQCPPVAIVLPVFDAEAYDYVKRNINDGSVLKGSLQEYLIWAESERVKPLNPLQPVVLVTTTRQELETLESPFGFEKIAQSVLSKFQSLLIRMADNATELSDQSTSLNYILIQIKEIGIDKANDIAAISHDMINVTPPVQNFIIKGERMKYEYALLLASAHCLSVGAETVYFFRNDDFKWK